MRFLDALGDVALHILDHHDRVIHHEPGGERDSEKRQRIDRESEQL